MGRHTAADGASAHPLVAAALAQRPADVTGAHREEPASAGEGGNVGWPQAPEPSAPRPGESPVGWPGGSGRDDQDTAVEDEPARTPPRLGWRRLFGAARAA
ncbi:hypothetical protein [Blastococcus saxobsidens]|uniref:Uncharacterized protein n=1 Tax=Blastococcus saxobsidens TaxID=138336 RepID=A0A4Q7YAR5_9ACTN|nr:hypothetical protein [Blastococcus saxobsidens]RZU33281.1 hypothetical protein BKA19_3002 [Blastococcus saxobsidens]